MQEPRLTAFISGDDGMINAYKKGQDLYSVIAQSAYDNAYEENLENFPEGTVLKEENKEVVCGNGNEYILETDNENSITVSYFYLINNGNDDIQADKYKIGDKISSDLGLLEIKNIVKQEDKIKFIF